MPTIRKRGTHQWQAIVKRAGYPLLSATFDQKHEAAAWARHAEAQMDEGTWASPKIARSVLVRDLLERYRQDVLPDKRGKHLSPALRRLDAEFGRYSVAVIGARQIAEFRDRRLHAGLSASTVRKELNLLSRIIDLAMREWGVPLPANPCKAVSRPIEHNARTRRLRPHEEQYLISATRPEVSHLIQLALETAARLGELLSLEWADIDLDKRVATTYGVDKLGTKNGAPLRAIPLTKKAVALLDAMPHTDARVFPTWCGSDSFNKTWHTAIAAAQKAYTAACKEHGEREDADFLRDLRFHDLRHEATSRIFEKHKLNSIEIAMVTGHKTLSMLSRYTHLHAAELAKQMD